jgi:hypothetical protein
MAQFGSAIVGAIALVILAAISNPIPGTVLTEAVLASVRGANPSYQGSGFWSCDEAQANAQGAQYLSPIQCKATTIQPFPPGLYCLRCPDDLSSGRQTTGQGKNISYVGKEQCSGRVQTTKCEKSLLGNYGECGTTWSFTIDDCTATFEDWADQ